MSVSVQIGTGGPRHYRRRGLHCRIRRRHEDGPDAIGKAAAVEDDFGARLGIGHAETVDTGRRRLKLGSRLESSGWKLWSDPRAVSWWRNRPALDLAPKTFLFEKRVRLTRCPLDVLLVLLRVFVLVGLHDRLSVGLDLSRVDLSLLLHLLDPCSDGGLGLPLVHRRLLNRHLACGLPFGIWGKGQIHHPQDSLLDVLRRDLIGDAHLALSPLHNRLAARTAEDSLQRRTLPLHLDDQHPGLGDCKTERGGPAVLDRKFLGPGR